MSKCEDVTHGNRIMSFHRHGGDQSINKNCKVTLNWGFSFECQTFLSNIYFWLVGLAMTWENYVPVHESPLVQRSTRLRMWLHIPLGGADPACTRLWATPAKRTISTAKGWVRLILQDSQPNHFPSSDIDCAKYRQLNPYGFQVAENCGGFFFPSQSKTSLLFTWTRKPKKRLF